jgi:hypothetical protein
VARLYRQKTGMISLARKNDESYYIEK